MQLSDCLNRCKNTIRFDGLLVVRLAGERQWKLGAPTLLMEAFLRKSSSQRSHHRLVPECRHTTRVPVDGGRSVYFGDFFIIFQS